MYDILNNDKIVYEMPRREKSSLRRAKISLVKCVRILTNKNPDVLSSLAQFLLQTQFLIRKP